jgi:hypothetical protein
MSQENDILDYLKRGNRLTPLEALKRFNCLRLAARIQGLRQQGHTIEMKVVETETGKHVAEYHLVNHGNERSDSHSV